MIGLNSPAIAPCLFRNGMNIPPKQQPKKGAPMLAEIAIRIPINVSLYVDISTANPYVAIPIIRIIILEHLTSSSIVRTDLTSGNKTVAVEDKNVEKLLRVAEQVAIKKIPVNPGIPLKWSSISNGVI